MQATVIVPIVAVLALIVKLVFGIEIGEELQAQIADAILSVILAGVAVFGIMKGQDVKKKKDKKTA